MNILPGYKLVVFTGLSSPGQIITGGVDPGDELVSVVSIAPIPVMSEDFLGQFQRGVQYNPGFVGGVISQIGSGFSANTFLALVKKGAGFVP